MEIVQAITEACKEEKEALKMLKLESKGLPEDILQKYIEDINTTIVSIKASGLFFKVKKNKVYN